MRLDKYVSHALGVGRAEAKSLIQRGEIMVNDVRVRKIGEIIQEETDIIMFQHERLKYKEFVYFMLHKPSGCISATHDEKEQTAMELLDEKDRRRGLSIVGRLDKDTEGLLLITNNGALSHMLTSPKKEVRKKYYVEIEGDLTEKDVLKFEEGIEIILSDTETYLTKSATLEILKTGEYSQAYVYIAEGKFHQIKKMFLAIGKKVMYLKRLAIGDLILDSNLPKGKYRELTNKEIELLKTQGVK